MSQERVLAAIMFTDIVGYTALMGKNEQQALALLKKNKELHERLITQYNGKLLKEIGDGKAPPIGQGFVRMMPLV